jgi:hypothetical protein
MITNITYGTFLFFGSSLVVGILTVILFLPETKGLSLEEMDILFSIKGLAHQQRKKADAVIQDMRSAENLVGTDKKEELVIEQTEQAENA